MNHRVYRVSGFLSSRPNRVPHPLNRKRVLLPPPIGSKGGDTLACGGGRGEDLISTQDRHTLWYSMYTILPLRSVRTTEQVRSERLWGFPLTTKGAI